MHRSPSSTIRRRARAIGPATPPWVCLLTVGLLVEDQRTTILRLGGPLVYRPVTSRLAAMEVPFRSDPVRPPVEGLSRRHRSSVRNETWRGTAPRRGSRSRSRPPALAGAPLAPRG